MISKLMEPVPNVRMSAAEVLHHPWVVGRVMRGHLSQTIDKDLGVFKENMRKKLKIGIRAVDAAMAFKKSGSVRGSAMAAQLAAAAAKSNAGTSSELAPAAEEGPEEGVALTSVKIEGTEEAL